MSKPKFDPNQPFEAVSESKPKFDPNAPFDVVQDSGDIVSKLESAARGAMQGATGNLSDEASGAIDAATRGTFLENAPEYLKIPGALALGPGLVAENIKQLVTGDKSIDDLRLSYKQGRDESRAANAEAQKENPGTYLASSIAGGIVSPAAKATQGLGLIGSGAALGGLYGFGGSEADNALDAASDTIKGAGVGALTGAAVQGAGAGLKQLGKSFGKSAEKLAENATGATRVQSQKYAKNAGRELLDSGIVGFADDAEKIAQKAGAKIRDSEIQIDNALKALDKKGVQVSQDDIVNALELRINDLKKDPSMSDVVRNLEQIVLDITATGQSKVALSSAEQIKRGFNRMAKNWQDPEKGQAGKVAYLAYRDAVEAAAKKADPAIADTFIKAKKTFGLLTPIENAAASRARQLDQSPIGGLMDTVTSGVGGGVAGIPGAVVGATARRVVAPRISSAMAVTLDKAGKAIATPGVTANTTKKLTLATGSQATAKPQGKGLEKWLSDGIQKVAGTGDVDKDFLENLKKTNVGRSVLLRASEIDPNSQQMQRVLEQIKTSEEYKKHLKQKEKSVQGKEPDQSSVKPQMKFPQVLQKDGFTAVVRNMSELDEARSEGWS